MCTYTQISLTYLIGGEYLIKSGEYDDCGNTVIEPIYERATKNVTLGKSFIDGALERPKKPHRKANISDWNTYNNWNKSSVETKLASSIINYVKDLGGSKASWELM